MFCYKQIDCIIKIHVFEKIVSMEKGGWLVNTEFHSDSSFLEVPILN